MKIETILTPAELPALAQRDLRTTACIVFDVLRATSTFVTALHHGAKAIIPVSEITEAVAVKNSEWKSEFGNDFARRRTQRRENPRGAEVGQASCLSRTGWKPVPQWN